MLIDNVASTHLTAFSASILNTLENLIAPGGRARLSPYVEATQLITLFDVLPLPKDRVRATQDLIRTREKYIQTLAKGWAEFCASGKSFRNNDYADRNFLESYLIYYFSVNVAKVQITLLDLLREGELTGSHFELADIGVGVGTSAVAVLDLLFAWKTVCDLYSVDFPVQTIVLHGLDRSRSSLDFAARVVKGFGRALTQRAETQMCSSVNLFIEAAENARWHVIDLETTNKLASGIHPTHLIASNVLSELSQTGQDKLADLIRSLPEDTIALLLEPGSQNNGSALMEWRRRLVMSGHFTRTGPCGQEYLDNPTDACRGCWNARRQSFHQPALYLAFRRAAEMYLGDKRRFDNFENNLLSWSNVWIKRGKPAQTASQREKIVCTNKEEPAQTFRYIGRYRINHAYNNPDDGKSETSLELKEYLKLCPIVPGEKPLILVRPAGFVVPVLKHGQLIRIVDGIRTTAPDSTVKIQVNVGTKIIPVDESVPVNAFLFEYSDRTRTAVDEIGYRLFGFEKMHSFQHRILERVLTGRSILGIAATGSGKSECFILPSITLPGVTVVVSPLISLMMDQYDQRITERYGLNQLTTYINGQVPFNDRQTRLRRLEMGYYKLVYFTPEQLERGHILDTLRRTNERVGVRYLAMDEAHCISQWGHDFRPSYLNLSRRMRDYGLDPVRIALTATASPYVRKDVCEELGLDSRLIDDGGDVFVESSNRPELNLIVRLQQTTRNKVDGILSDLRNLLAENKNDQAPGSAIVFLPTTGGNPDSVYPTEQWKADRGKYSTGVTHFAAFLERNLNQRVTIYHSKMDMDADTESASITPWKPGDLRGRCRRSEQQAFIKGEVPIMVATKGFGMGIDKDNVRLIIHRTPPSNLEAYAQEAGRAGRDGNLADVILYYSPDSPEDDNGFGKIYRERSDHDIQSYFLSEKYIRRQDVMVMRAFLKTVTHRVGKTLYFTNDEALDFFNRCMSEPLLANLDNPFAWPSFPSRRSFGYESEEHQVILDRGYLYQSRTTYLDRILQALYRIRPDIPGVGGHCAFLEQVQETGAELRNPKVLCPDAILQSNAYFGQILRKAGISANELMHLITNANLLHLATRLSLSMYETSSLLNDIKSAEGIMGEGRWQPGLLDFRGIHAPKFGLAADKQSLSDWRSYAGAFERANKSVANDRAKKASRKMVPMQYRSGLQQDTTLDDWFSEKELNKPRGWEILPGPAFINDDKFEYFIQAFMQLHDQRKENDWASYHRLLRDYVGVEENGQLASQKRVGNCLRSVLLGYLETYELVSGDNCYGCSRCVKDGNFGKYSLEQRQSAVVRMVPTISALFDRMKEQPKSIPSSDDVQLLFNYILSEQQAGRSLLGYFSGWSARLLDQMPDHRPALWLRMEGMAEELLSFQPQEFLKNAQTLHEYLETEDLNRLDQVVRKVSEEFNNDPPYKTLQANIARKVGDYEREAQLLQEQIEHLQEQPSVSHHWLYPSATRLLELHGMDGPLPQPDALGPLHLLAGRTASSEELSRRWYEPVVKSWAWAEVSNELEAQSRYNSPPHSRAALCLIWSGNNSERWTALGTWIGEHPDIFAKWSDANQSLTLNHLPFDILVSFPKLGQEAILKSTNHERVIRLGKDLLAGGENLTPQVRKRMTEKMIQVPQVASSILEGVTTEESRSLLNSLNSVAEFSDWGSLETWLDLQPYETLSSEYALHWFETGLDLLPPPPKTTNCINRLGRLLEALITQEHLDKQALDAWLPIALKNLETIEIQGTLIDYITRIAQNSPVWADAFPKYQLVIRNWDWTRLEQEFNSLEQRLASEIPILRLLETWLHNHNEEEHDVENYIGLKATIGRWSFLVVQSLTHDLNQKLIEALNLTIEWADKLSNGETQISEPEKFLDVVFNIAATDHKLPGEVISFSKDVLNHVNFYNRTLLFKSWFSEPAKINKLINVLIDDEEIIPVPLALFWLNKNDEEDIVSYQPRIARKMLESLSIGFDEIPLDAIGINKVRQQLGSIVDELMENPASRLFAHQYWMKLCEFWPEEAVLHLRQCLMVNPPQGDFAEECLKIILSHNEAPLLSGLVQLLQQKKLKGASNRIDQLIDLVQSMRELEINCDIADASELAPRHLAMFFYVFKPRANPYRADMASELIRLLCERIYSNWKTPLAYQVEALVYGNHIGDALKIAEPSLTIGRDRLFINDFINSVSKELKSVPDYRHDYYKLFAVLTSRWKYRSRLGANHLGQ